MLMLAGRPKYLQFQLCKEGKGTMEAISLLARFVHRRPQDFAYAGAPSALPGPHLHDHLSAWPRVALIAPENIAQTLLCAPGTKDKRAVTTQRVTCHQMPAKQLAGLNKRLYGASSSALLVSWHEWSLLGPPLHLASVIDRPRPPVVAPAPSRWAEPAVCDCIL